MTHEPIPTPSPKDPRSLRGKAALTALVIAGALALFLLLPNLAAQKISPWRGALPTAAMNATQAKTALMRAEYLHEAAVRPLLIKAGFYGPEDVSTEGKPHHSRTMANSLSYASMLWAFRDFSEVHDKLLDGLLDTGLPAPLRSQRFLILANTLSGVAEMLAKEKSGWISIGGYFPVNAANRMAYFNNNPLLESNNAVPSPEILEVYRQKLALAREFLPFLLTDMVREMNTVAAGSSKVSEEGKQTSTAQKLLGDPTPFARYAGEALLAIWNKRHDTTFRPLAFELLKEPGARAAERYPAVRLLAEKPGMSRAEYLAWAPYSADLNNIKTCVGTEPRSFGYLIGCCDKLGDVLRADMKKQGLMLMESGTGLGIAVRKVDGPPALPAPEQGTFFLLADMSQALKNAPAYDLNRVYPVLAGTPLRHLENPPLLLPLKAGDEGDEALLRWHAEKGWQQGRTLLLSSKAAPKALAAHLATLQLMWWPQKDKDGAEKEQMAYMHYQNGAFMTAVLPYLKGEVAARFLGPVTGLWFGVQEVEGDQWYSAALQAPAEQPLAGAPTLYITPEVNKQLGVQYRLRGWVELARYLLAKYPVPARTPLQATSFVGEAEKELYQWGFKSAAERKTATEYLWRFRGDAEATEKLRAILSDDAVKHSAQKLRDARSAMRIAETD